MFGDDLSIALWYVFVLSLVLILVAYYKGVQTDTQQFSQAFQSLLNTATGRDKNGNFVAYPKQG